MSLQFDDVLIKMLKVLSAQALVLLDKIGFCIKSSENILYKSFEQWLEVLHNKSTKNQLKLLKALILFKMIDEYTLTMK
jgi:hypothetical protein